MKKEEKLQKQISNFYKKISEVNPDSTVGCSYQMRIGAKRAKVQSAFKIVAEQKKTVNDRLESYNKNDMTVLKASGLHWGA